MSRRDDLLASLRVADALATNPNTPPEEARRAREDAQKLADAVRSEPPAGSSSEPSGFFAPGQRAANAVEEGVPGLAASTVEAAGDFGRGAYTGFRNIGTDVGRLVADFNGDEDVLAGLNKLKSDRKLADAEYQKRSPWAYGAGDIVGEGIALAPLGGLSGGLIKGGLSAAGRASTGWLAAGGTLGLEGAASGFLTSEGKGEGSRLTDAAIGAGANIAGGALLGGAMDVGGGYIRALGRSKSGIEDTVNARIDETITPRVQEADEFGGYTIDGNTAAATRTSLQEVKDMRNANDISSDMIEDFIADQEEAVTARATLFVEQFGESAGKTFSDANRLLAESLSSSRDKAKDAYVEAYERLDELALTQNYILPGKDQLATGVSRMDIPVASSVGPKVQEIFQKYGVSANVTAKDSVEYLAKRVGGPGKQLTFGTSEQLRKELNAFYGNGKLNNGDKQVIEQAKELLDGFIDGALADPKIGGSVTQRAAVTARTLRAEFSQNWDEKSIINMIANSAGEGKGPRIAMDQAITKLTKGQDTRNLKTVKARLMGMEGGDEVWKSVQQAPLLQALEAATAGTGRARTKGGGIPFDGKKFEASLKGTIHPDAQDTLWEGATYGKDFINRAAKSWQMRDVTTLGGFRDNPSGSGLLLLSSLRFLPSGGKRNAAMIATAVLPKVTDVGIGQPRRLAAIGNMTKGEVSEKVRYQMELEAYDAAEQTYRAGGLKAAEGFIDAFAQQYKGGGTRRYEEMLRNIVRRGIVFEDSDQE